jgi:hypothetical protein
MDVLEGKILFHKAPPCVSASSVHAPTVKHPGTWGETPPNSICLFPPNMLYFPNIAIKDGGSLRAPLQIMKFERSEEQ